ncbi:MAG: multi-sensor hybrid histidine kinase [Acidimicrobiales bacterium]|jgi:signal transduction histidine kinase|nr:multi-sensor hybrid histidine kinase [Acidimicrobiales bacterium]
MAAPAPDRSRALLELIRDVTSTLDLQAVLDRSLAAIRQLIDFDGGSIQLIDGGALRMVAADPPAPPEAFQFRLPVGEGFGGRVAATGEVVYSPDATIDERAHPEGRRRASTAGVRSYFAAPLISQGRPIGVIQIDSFTVDAFPPDRQEAVLAFLPSVSAAVQNALLFSRERDALQRQQQTDRLKHDFLAVISHELRTPLTAILGFAATLASRARSLDPEMVVQMAARIERAGLRLGVLMDDLLDLSKIERGELEVLRSPTALHGIVERVMTERAGRADRVTVVLDDDLPAVLADAHRVYQVLTKLLDNALKFSADDAEVRIEGRRIDAHRVGLAVVDRGPGIAEGDVERLFEPFLQIEDPMTRTFGGMGTGLYLAREICAAIGGTLEVESTVGEGSRFTMVLPVSPVRPVTDAEAS